MDATNRAIELAGNISKLAIACGVTPQAVCFWRDDLRQPSAERCTAIERATGGLVTRKELRPDDWAQLWPELCQTKPMKEAA